MGKDMPWGEGTFLVDFLRVFCRIFAKKQQKPKLFHPSKIRTHIPLLL
jgi:hypothetical protein